MRIGHSIVALGVAISLAGCGTMRITAEDPGAHIYAGGRALGRGTAELSRRGMPGSTTIIAVSDDGRRAQTIARREFTALTLITGFFTYGICMFACWEYPSDIYLPMPAKPKSMDLGAQQLDDLWLNPPAGWTPRKATAPAAANPSTSTPAP
jgi:hypothetical protein